MIVSDLYTPLPARPVRRPSRIPARAAAACACLAIAGAVGLALLRDDGRRGDPVSVGSINVAPRALAAVTPPPLPPPADPGDAAAHIDPQQAASNQQVTVESGVIVVRGASPAGPGPSALKVSDLIAPKPVARADTQVIEPSPVGPLPRIGRNGRRPSEVYAATPVVASGRPRLALVLGGMGLDRVATARAVTELPAAVTFGFAPYGDALGEQVGLARAAGHEVVLQMPMEDFGSDDRALPQMLKADGGGNPERLRWLMSRFTGYAGVSNYLGGRLLSSEGSLKPLLQEIAARGLYFVDDGSAPRSVAMPLAHDLNLPAAKGDIVIDAQADPASVAAALLRLERQARDRGVAIGFATGRPATNTQIARYLAEAVKRGLVIVPVSQAVADGNGLLARR